MKLGVEVTQEQEDILVALATSAAEIAEAAGSTNSVDPSAIFPSVFNLLHQTHQQNKSQRIQDEYQAKMKEVNPGLGQGHVNYPPGYRPL